MSNNLTIIKTAAEDVSLRAELKIKRSPQQGGDRQDSYLTNTFVRLARQQQPVLIPFRIN